MVIAIAHPNIALIKYWGKSDPEKNLPASPSLSLTLSAFKTFTSVTIDSDLKNDVFILNGNHVENYKLTMIMNKVRELSNCPSYAIINSENNFPTSAGFASSASGMAALSVACNSEYNMGLDHDDLAKLARLGSGSATRSIDGGLVIWPTGSHESSFGQQIKKPDQVPLAVLSITTKSSMKKISSTQAMEIVRMTSPFYRNWITSSTKDFHLACKLITEKKWEQLLMLAETNSLKMHACTLASDPAIIYFEPETLKLINFVQKVRQEKQLPVYCSIDAGPNVKVLTTQDKLESVLTEFKDWHPHVSLPGMGAQIID